MAQTLKGRVVKLEAPTAQTAGDRSWANQQLILDYGEMQSINFALDFDPDKMPEAASAMVGDIVEVEYFGVANEGKNANAGKWFSKNILRNITFVKTVARPTSTSAPAAAPVEKATAPAPVAAETADESSELPF